MAFLLTAQTHAPESSTPQPDFTPNSIAFDELQIVIPRDASGKLLTPDALPRDFERAYQEVLNKRAYTGAQYGILFRYAYYYEWRRFDSLNLNETLLANLRTHAIYYLDNDSKIYFRFGPHGWTELQRVTARDAQDSPLFDVPFVTGDVHATLPAAVEQTRVPDVYGLPASEVTFRTTLTGAWITKRFKIKQISEWNVHHIFADNLLEPCPRFFMRMNDSTEPAQFCNGDKPAHFVLYDRQQIERPPMNTITIVTERGHLQALGRGDLGRFMVPPGYHNGCNSRSTSEDVARLYCS